MNTKAERLAAARSKVLAAKGVSLISEAASKWVSGPGLAGEIGFDFLIAEHAGRPTLVSAHVNPWAHKKGTTIETC